METGELIQLLTEGCEPVLPLPRLWARTAEWLAIGLVYAFMAPSRPAPRRSDCGGTGRAARIFLEWRLRSAGVPALVQSSAPSSTVGAASATVGKGVALLPIYSLGLGVPFVVAAAFTDGLLARLKTIGRVGRGLRLFAGSVMILTGGAPCSQVSFPHSRSGSWTPSPCSPGSDEPEARRESGPMARDVLELLASVPRGLSDAVLIANGFTSEMLFGLAREGLATTEPRGHWGPWPGDWSLLSPHHGRRSAGAGRRAQ
jgi:hypothetical protein